MNNSISLIAILSFFTLLPFLIAAGTCYIKFSIVFVIVRNALGLQQVPSNMTLNGIALILSFFVMFPVIDKVYSYSQSNSISFEDSATLSAFVNTGLSEYKEYLIAYSDSKLVSYFDSVLKQDDLNNVNADNSDVSIISLLPAYALSEIKSAFKIGFYIYLPFIVIDLIISCLLLTLGMMMMSPITLSTPIKLILFVAIDGWSLLSKGLVEQYTALTHV